MPAKTRDRPCRTAKGELGVLQGEKGDKCVPVLPGKNPEGGAKFPVAKVIVVAAVTVVAMLLLYFFIYARSPNL